MIVIDTNILVYYLLDGYEKMGCYDLLRKIGKWYAPNLLITEFDNSLLLFLKQKIITEQECWSFHRVMRVITEDRFISVETSKILKLAIQSGLSIYDAEFVTVAIEHDLPLITHDKKILRLFRNLAFKPQDYLALHFK